MSTSTRGENGRANLIAGEADITLIPTNNALAADLFVTREARSASKPILTIGV